MEHKQSTTSHCMVPWRVFILILFALTTVRYIAAAQSQDQDSLKYWNLNAAQDHFWDPNCPTSPTIMDGWTLWMLRQKLAVQAYQTIMNTEMNLDSKNAK